MPIHDWSRAPAGYFHHFHQFWSVGVCNGLNEGRLPPGYFALIEQSAAGYQPDLLTLREQDNGTGEVQPKGGIAVADAPPKARFVSHADEVEMYTLMANRVVIRRPGGRVVCAIEIMSPGNKSGQRPIASFVQKSIEFLARGVNLLVIDLFPPTARDPQGIHPMIWGEIRDEPFVLPADKPLTLASYVAGPSPAAYVEPVAVGDVLPDMAVFLDPETYVPAPLESTYEQTWERCPGQFRELVLNSIR